MGTHHFNSRPHGGRLDVLRPWAFFGNFNSRPHGGRRNSKCFIFKINCISTHALTEGDISGGKNGSKFIISTHALTEGDADLLVEEPAAGYFNSRPHGGRPKLPEKRILEYVFQLTPSRRATAGAVDPLHEIYISTHALTEGDIDANDVIFYYTFQLTPSRRATVEWGEHQDWANISTHALTEGDFLAWHSNRRRLFQLTPSRRATDGHCWPFRLIHISTHALTEGDFRFVSSENPQSIFQLTPSRRATRRCRC